MATNAQFMIDDYTTVDTKCQPAISKRSAPKFMCRNKCQIQRLYVCYLYFKLEWQSSKCRVEKGKTSFVLALKEEKYHNGLM